MTNTSRKSENPQRPQIAVGAIIFHNDRVLLVKRRHAPAKDCWAIPGGKVRWGETLQQAAEREVLEETDIVCRAGKTVHLFELLPEQAEQFHYLIIDLEAEYLSGKPQAGDDAKAARWFNRQDFAKYDITSTTRKLLAEKYDFK